MALVWLKVWPTVRHISTTQTHAPLVQPDFTSMATHVLPKPFPTARPTLPTQTFVPFVKQTIT